MNLFFVYNNSRKAAPATKGRRFIGALMKAAAAQENGLTCAIRREYTLRKTTCIQLQNARGTKP
jgi:hypothetical protein